MNRILPITLLMISLSLDALANVSPGIRETVTLSNDNPNRLICLNGNINDVLIPAHIPHDLQILRDHAFITYKMKRKGGSLEYVTIPHDINIVCDGEVYTLNTTPINKGGNAINLGNPQSDEIIANARKLQEMSIEDIFIEMFLDAYANDLPPNYSVSEESETVDLNPHISATLRRTIALNGIGIQMKEYMVESNTDMHLNNRMFLNSKFSKKMRGVVVVPEIATPSKPARLFIIEDK